MYKIDPGPGFKLEILMIFFECFIVFYLNFNETCNSYIWALSD